MSNLINLQTRLARLSRKLVEIQSYEKTDENIKLAEDIEDEIDELTEEIDGMEQDDYNDRHYADFR